MSIVDVESLTGYEVNPNSLVPRRGTHRIAGRVTNAWLGFTDRGLESLALSKVYGISRIRQSPRRNLCTGELTFFLELQWVDAFQGSSVYLEGELLVENAKTGVIVEIPVGQHELRVETPEGVAAIKEVIFRREDPGNRLLVFTEEDIGSPSVSV